MKKILFAIWLFSFIVVSPQTKKVMVEIFTSTTCGPCAFHNQAFDNWLRNFAGKDNVVVMKYHVWWPAPGNDPFYLANTTDPQTRRTFYNTNAVPNCYVDGVDYSYNYASWVNGISSKLPGTSLFNIVVTGIKTGNDFDITIKVDASGTLPPSNYVLHVGVVESELIYTGPNGDPRHEQVLRKMYPNASGESMNIQAGQTKYFTRKISWNSNWKVEKSELVVFIQSNSTKTVMQANKSNMQTLTSVEENEMLPTEFILYQNYPNPFNPETVFSYQLPKASQVSLKVYDILGREIASLVEGHKEAGFYNTKFSMLNSDISNGIYFYKLQATPIDGSGQTFKDVKKMVLLK
jgi:hypothetical protein